MFVSLVDDEFCSGIIKFLKNKDLKSKGLLFENLYKHPCYLCSSSYHDDEINLSTILKLLPKLSAWYSYKGYSYEKWLQGYSHKGCSFKKFL